jgi:hypothetical protein
MGSDASSGNLAKPVNISPSGDVFVVGNVGATIESISSVSGQNVMSESLPVVISSDQIVPISAASLPLPSGAATEAGNLASIKAKTDNIPALGQALAAASVPIVLTAAQLTTLTPPAAISGFATAAKQDLLLTELQLKADLTDTQPVSIAGSVPVTGTFFQATQPVSIAAVVPVSDNGGSLTVDGTFWQATQPISGTVSANATLAAETTKVIGTVNIAAAQSVNIGAAIPAGTNNIGDVDIATLPNVTLNALPVGTNNIGDVDVLSLPALPTGANTIGAVNINGTVPVSMGAASVLFKGRASTFRTPGRAGTAGQKILSIHNATGSAITISVTKIFVDMYQTVVKAITVAPPIIRAWKVTVLPTNGTALAKNKIGGTSTSSASVTVLGDASADGTGSASTLTATLPAGSILSQEYAPRYITAVGYEMADRIEFFSDSTIALNALEGIVVFLDYTLATQNPITDMWIAGIEWSEV